MPATIASEDIPPAAAARRDEWRFVALVMLGGLAVRLIWLLRVHGRILDFLSAAEASRVALAVAQHGTIADAYFSGQGPTAHLLPINPMIAGGMMWLFGPGTTGADLALLGWSLAQVAAGYLLIRALFRKLGTNATALRWATALLFLVPPFVPQEVVDFRYWEGGSALALGALNLLWIVRVDRERAMGGKLMLGAAALSAVTLFVCPSVGLATDLCWGVVALRRLPLQRAAGFALASALALAVLIVPWTLRNQAALGAPVMLRSNFGIELAMANYPGALDDSDPAHAFDRRLNHIHPAANAALRPAIAAPGGEVRYSRMLADRTEHWISSHPAAFARLWLRHLRQFVAPEAWQMYFTGWEGMRWQRALAISLVDCAGLAGLLLGLLAGQRGYWVPALYVAAVALPYAAFQPMPRYSFLIYAVLAFPAVEAVLRIAAVRLGRASGSGIAWAR